MTSILADTRDANNSNALGLKPFFKGKVEALEIAVRDGTQTREVCVRLFIVSARDTRARLSLVLLSDARFFVVFYLCLLLCARVCLFVNVCFWMGMG